MLSIVIQAGGESKRMGRDKALVPFLGRPLIWRVLERVGELADEVVVTTNRPENYPFLNVVLAPDKIPGRGALGGLYTALSAASHPMVAVVACDMPFASPELLKAQLDLLAGSLWDAAAGLSRGQEVASYDAVIPRTQEGSEPFHAVYLKSRCLPLVEAAIQDDKWRVDAWYSQANVRFLDPDECRPYDPDGRAFWNVNTPEELAEAEAIARQSPSI